MANKAVSGCAVLLNSNAVTFEYEPVVRMPRRQIWSGFAKVNVQVPGERDQAVLRKVAAENGLLPCIGSLDPVSGGKGSSIKLG